MFGLMLALIVTACDYPAKTNTVVLSENPNASGLAAAVETERGEDGVIRYTATIRSGETPVRDRALVVRFLLPCATRPNALHTHFPRVPVPIDHPRKDYHAQLAWGHKELGSDKMLSGVPVVGVSAEGKREGLAFGVAMTCPVVSRLGYDAARNAVYAECDLGLAAEQPCAVVRLLSFPFAAEDGFRGGWERYMAFHPEAFRVRVKKHGTWLAILPASKIPGWQDFGFTFMEHDNDIAGDDARGIYSLRYTSSSSWTIGIPTNMPNDIASARIVAAQRAAQGDRRAQAWKDCQFLDEKGEPACKFFNVHWLRGVSWNLNAEPDLPAAMTPYLALGNSSAELDARYAKPFPQGLDGEFVDSTSGFGVALLDFNRRHYAHMKDAPLSYAHDSGRVGIPSFVSTRGYIRKLSGEMRARGRILMLNDCAGLYPFISPYADVLGIETTSVDTNGNYRQKKEHLMLQWRMLAGKKPYCIFQNCDFTRLTPEFCERYMMRMLAYGFLPSYFSPLGDAIGRGRSFFHVPEFRERARPLFKKYFPTLKAVSEAGWEPVSRTLASSEPDVVTVEQFGTPASPKGCYVTIHNPSNAPVSATLVPTHGFPAAAEYRDVVSGEAVPVRTPFTLPAYATRVVRCAASSAE